MAVSTTPSRKPYREAESIGFEGKLRLCDEGSLLFDPSRRIATTRFGQQAGKDVPRCLSATVSWWTWNVFATL